MPDDHSNSAQPKDGNQRNLKQIPILPVLSLCLSLASGFYWKSLLLIAQQQSRIEQVSQVCGELVAESASVSSLADCLTRLGLMYVDGQHHVEAIVLLRNALTLAKDTNDQALEGFVLCNLAYSYLALNQYSLASQLTEAGLAITRAIGDRGVQVHCLVSRGVIAVALNQTSAAIAFYLEALKLAQQLDDLGLQSQIRQYLKDAQDAQFQ
ncbi:hypothetical protein HJG54_00955 [Leptolyngbya sp. NK1-12]|uniref:Tetratricopeptide repeat protein n=1 Tax=Leptolyngbya sp. NK1-12 TaxID=2547451 RepID=A0AA96W8A1_9CYAN|nr:hypothetical protein [Leptolyngbya sp. NK1-12]WNZ21577.1 hypothetical protein HJG54_00955 [Leptolyngbya sp. NK1-12]